jgi:hypothetical protein
LVLAAYRRRERRPPTGAAGRERQPSTDGAENVREHCRSSSAICRTGGQPTVFEIDATKPSSGKSPIVRRAEAPSGRAPAPSADRRPRLPLRLERGQRGRSGGLGPPPAISGAARWIGVFSRPSASTCASACSHIVRDVAIAR